MGLLLKYTVKTGIRVKIEFEQSIFLTSADSCTKFDFKKKIEIEKRQWNNRKIRCVYFGKVFYYEKESGWFSSAVEKWTECTLAITNIGVFKFIKDETGVLKQEAIFLHELGCASYESNTKLAGKLYIANILKNNVVHWHIAVEQDPLKLNALINKVNEVKFVFADHKDNYIYF